MENLYLTTTQYYFHVYRNPLIGRYSNSGVKSHSHSAASTLPTVIDIGSPGAITLVFQALLPFLLFHAPSTTSPNSVPQPIHLTLKGGTNVSLSPSYDYLSQVLLPTLSKIGLPPIHLNPLKRGWTTGAHEIGALSVTVDPLALESSLPAFSLTERGEIANVNATVLAPRSCEKDFQRELRAEFADVLPNTPIEIKYESSGHAKRLYLLLVATTSTGCKLGRDWLYDRRITSLPAAVNQMVKQVVGELKAEIESGACVDEYCADQLVVFRALAKGRSVVNCGFDENGGARERSLHEQTAWWVAREMLGVELDEDGGCEGVGFVVGERLDGRRAREESELEEIEERIERLEVT